MPAQLLVTGINGNKRPPDANEREIIKQAVASDEARKVYADEIAAARLEGDHNFADGLQDLLDEADRVRTRERAAPRWNQTAQRPAAVTTER